MKERKLIMSERWTKEDIDYLKENYTIYNIDNISWKLSRNRNAIKTKACKLGLTNNQEWTFEEINYLLKNHQNQTKAEIALHLNRTETAVSVKMSKLGLILPKYHYDRSFFKNINTEEKAYWLGFMYADGCVHVTHTPTYSAEVCIKLYTGDFEHLKKFNKCLNGNIPVTFDENICSFNNKTQKSCSIRCYSVEMAEDLISHGCIPNKTFFIELPQLPTELYRHFLRGYFDGDGCISLRSNKRKDLKIDYCSASKKILEQIRELLFQFEIKSYIVDEKKSTYRLIIGGLKNVDNMVHFLYDDATIYLDRKYNKTKQLYQENNVAQRLLRLSEMIG